jgi:hypothetical protein
MSTRANLAKAEMDFRQLLRTATIVGESGSTAHGLDAFAWGRLAGLAAYTTSLPRDEVMAIPLVIMPPPHVPSLHTPLLAEAALRAAIAISGSRNWHALVMNCHVIAEQFKGKKAHKLAHRYLERLMSHITADIRSNPGKSIWHAVEDAGWHRDVREGWNKVCLECKDDGLNLAVKRLTGSAFCEVGTREELELRMGTATRGYVSADLAEMPRQRCSPRP